VNGTDEEGARLDEIAEMATAMMSGNRAAALCWIDRPNPFLGGDSPREHLRARDGFSDVVDLIGRVRHGVMS